MKWVVIDVGGDIAVHDEELTLEQLQQAVDGYAEHVASPDPDLPVSVFINEERKSHSNGALQLNGKATTFLSPVLWPGTRIVGPMVVAGPADADGELTSLSDEQVAYLKGRFGG